MPFVIDDAFLPAILTAEPMTDEQFSTFCAEHPDLNFEMTAEGELIVMPPTHSFGGVNNSDVGGQVAVWAKKDRRGFVCDSSTALVLPNGSRRSPDVSWILKTRVKGMEQGKQQGFWHLCPDFVIEIRSDTDRLKPLQGKMREYLVQGAQLGWLIDPQSKTVEIYRPDGSVETRADIDELAGEGPVAGFVLDLTYVWDPFAD
jgi:Uma2 family endonuclease